MIPFNKPFLTGKETDYIKDAVESGKISGNGKYTQRCHQYFEQKYGFKKCLLTTSCTDALEMAAILLNLKEGDEVIMPSYTFVSTANAFVLRGAKIVFADSNEDHPNMNVATLEPLISDRTKAIVVVHYAGDACDMKAIMELANKHQLFVVEDAAQSIDNFYIDRGEKKPLGGIGHLAAFSFHETKNIISGEGGMLVVNDDRFTQRAEIIWEKGTNRSQFFRGEVDKYGWVDVGSSFLPSEVIAAFLYAQLENMEAIQAKRKLLWNTYYELFSKENNMNVLLPHTPSYSTNNAHMFYIVCSDVDKRTAIIQQLKSKDILSVFHYISLHSSPFYLDKHDGRTLPQTDRFTECLLRLPMYYDLRVEDIHRIVSEINATDFHG